MSDTHATAHWTPRFPNNQYFRPNLPGTEDFKRSHSKSEYDGRCGGLDNRKMFNIEPLLPLLGLWAIFGVIALVVVRLMKKGVI